LNAPSSGKAILIFSLSGNVSSFASNNGMAVSNLNLKEKNLGQVLFPITLANTVTHSNVSEILTCTYF
jgi:hypothetical protein